MIDTTSRRVRGYRAAHVAAMLSPLLVMSVVIVTYVIFYGAFIQCAGSGRLCVPFNVAHLLRGIQFNAATAAAGYVGRAMWVLSNAVNALVCVAALFAGGVVIYRSLPRHTERIRSLLIALVIAWSANVALLVSLWASYDTSAPAPTLLRATAAQEIYHLNTFNRLFDTLGLTAAFTLAFAACATLWRRPGDAPWDAAAVKRRMRRLRTVLYSGAAVLILGVLRLSVLLNWGLSYLPRDSAEGRLASDLVTGIVSALGTYYTLIIAAVYIPAALVLRARAQALAERESPEQGEQWLEKNGLTISLVDNLPRLIAILGPMLAGPVGDLIARLAKTTVS